MLQSGSDQLFFLLKQVRVFLVVPQREWTDQLHVRLVLGMCGRGGVYSERRYLTRIPIHNWYHTAVFDIP